jgi:hypothetical protein
MSFRELSEPAPQELSGAVSFTCVSSEGKLVAELMQVRCRQVLFKAAALAKP